MFEAILKTYFSGLGVTLSKSFVKYTNGIISANSFSTHEIARHVSKETGKDFNTSEKGLNYLLNNTKFQIDDTYWRHHVTMIFDLMTEQNCIKIDDTIYIQVDFTTDEDFFLILTASVIINDHAIPLYFTMRNYPKKKNQYDHKKMESAFLKGLKHLLSKKYRYVIVADRGFGNERFLKSCGDNGFDYLIRATPNFKIQTGEKEGIVDEVCEKDGSYDVQVIHWEHKKVTIHKNSTLKESWILLSNIKGLAHHEASKIYANRFKIEKCFQDLKSSGFNIEKTKIRKYSNYKRLLAMVMVAHALLVFLGHVIAVKIPAFLKNSALMANVILAYFQSEERLMPYLQKPN